MDIRDNDALEKPAHLQIRWSIGGRRCEIEQGSSRPVSRFTAIGTTRRRAVAVLLLLPHTPPYSRSSSQQSCNPSCSRSTTTTMLIKFSTFN